jgi:hypothetical protein
VDHLIALGRADPYHFECIENWDQQGLKAPAEWASALPLRRVFKRHSSRSDLRRTIPARCDCERIKPPAFSLTMLQLFGPRPSKLQHAKRLIRLGFVR